MTMFLHCSPLSPSPLFPPSFHRHSSPSSSPLPRVTVEEGVGVLEVVVERVQGVVGAVSVVYLVTDVGATNGEDFSVDSLNVRRGGRRIGRKGEREGREHRGEKDFG